MNLPKPAALVAAILLAAFASGARAEAVVIDDFTTIDAWTTGAPEGVTVSAHLDENGADGSAIRVDYEFVTGGGYCVVRREVDLALPENYRFSFDVRGDGLANNLEFKIVGPTTPGGEDVWWVNRRAYTPPREWTHLADKRRSFEFAWGPSEGKPLQRIVAIEIAIAMHEGGKGSLWLDNLTFEELPPPTPYTATPVINRADDATVIDFQQLRDFGGLVLRWKDGSGPISCDIETTPDGESWTRITRIRDGVGGVTHLRTPDAAATAVRIRWIGGEPRDDLESFDVLSLDVGDDLNAFLSRVSADSPRGWYPKQFTGKQCFWTVVGAPDSGDEGLLSEHGAYEIYPGGPTLEPFVIADEQLLSWADGTVTCTLADGYIPIPTVSRAHGGLTLDITALHSPRGSGDEQFTGLLRYRVTNTTDAQNDGFVALALRPMQVLPPWQRLNINGGVSRIDHVHFQNDALSCNDAIAVAEALTKPSWKFAAKFAEGDVVHRLASGSSTRSISITDEQGLASAALCWAFDLAPGASTDIIVRVPTGKLIGAGTGQPRFASDWPQYFQFVHDAEVAEWQRLLNRAEFTGPPQSKLMWDTVRSNLGYILINTDGPAIHPGSRAYERSWIRDGSLTGTALLNLGHGELVIEFLRWYSDHLYDNGKVPCVVDRRGPDPYPEHDSPGQYIYLVLKTALVTGDTALARDLYPKALAAVGYIEALRAERMTPKYADPNSDLHRFYGILPESGSHEGYMNKPMHSFWDDFFCLRGLGDIVRLAELVGDTADVPRLIALRDSFRECFGAAIAGAIRDHNIDYIPGCVELGDFDAPSTAIGIFPCAEAEWMPRPQTQQTFDKFWKVLEGRIADNITWHDYTPYETRLIGVLALLGHPDRAHRLMQWLFLDQLPPGWNHWAEVAYREDDFPGWIGDMPHTWVGSGFINSVRTMFISEVAIPDALTVCLGAPLDWIRSDTGIACRHWPTEFGVANLTVKAVDDRIVCEVSVDRLPPGGIVFRVPGDAPITSAKATRGEVESVNGRDILLRGVDCRVEVTLN